MEFPVIKTIDDILSHINGNDNFSINMKDGYIVINYILNTPDLFNNPYEKECRGIIFDAETGKILSRPYHKFFNLNEREESSNVDFSKPHILLEKLDGSMIRAFKVGDRWIWGSKAGETFLTSQVEEFIKDKPQYLKFVKDYSNHTLIWEWCTLKNRIVLSYPEDRLVLTAMRHTETGQYALYENMELFASLRRIDYVKPFRFN